jgi:hypothetical protein
VRPSPCNRKTDTTMLRYRGGYALFIKFSTGHALPLGQPRSSWSRNGRGNSTECPLNVHGIGQFVSTNSPRPQTVHVHKQSTSTDSPRPWTVHVHGHVRIHGYSTSTDAFTSTDSPRPQTRPCPRTFYVHGQVVSVAKFWPRKSRYDVRV